MTTKISNHNLKQFFIKELAIPCKNEIKDLSFLAFSIVSFSKQKLKEAAKNSFN